MNRNHIFLMFVSSIALLSTTLGDEDPFKTESDHNQDVINRVPSSKYLSDEILGAFKESRLDKGVGEAATIIRVTILRNSKDPIMFVLRFISSEKVNLIVKIIHNDNNNQLMTSTPTILVSEGRLKLLKKVLDVANVENLPTMDWRGEEMLDGSRWIFEMAAGKEVILLERRSPLDYPKLDNRLNLDRLSREKNMVSFVSMLWMLADLRDGELE